MGDTGPRVLVIDDERAIRRLLRASLSAHGYQVLEATSGREGLDAAASERPDLIILDLGLPDLDGVDVTRRLREWSKAPVVILSVRGRDDEKIAALDAGADDYLTKPFSMGELLARMRVALRHAAQPADEPIITVGELTVDVARRLTTVGGREVALTPVEYSLLRTLAVYAGRVMTHAQLRREVWGPGYIGDGNLLRVSISKLRHKIEADPASPGTSLPKPGVGYRLRVAN
jgi:two-component system KDP operon response regulator KdpE